jgi:hypothetical protein
MKGGPTSASTGSPLARPTFIPGTPRFGWFIALLACAFEDLSHGRATMLHYPSSRRPPRVVVPIGIATGLEKRPCTAAPTELSSVVQGREGVLTGPARISAVAEQDLDCSEVAPYSGHMQRCIAPSTGCVDVYGLIHQENSAHLGQECREGPLLPVFVSPKEGVERGRDVVRTKDSPVGLQFHVEDEQVPPIVERFQRVCRFYVADQFGRWHTYRLAWRTLTLQ